MSDLVSEIEEIARRVYREERASEPEAAAPARHSPAADAATQERINLYSLVSHKPYLTRKEAALYLDVSERSIAEWAARPADENPFPESHAGGAPRAKRERIDEWVRRESARRRLRIAG
jgi:hypothetical protein